jgi:uncharacterized protein
MSKKSDRTDPKSNKSLAIRNMLKKMPNARASEIADAVKKEYGHTVGANIIYMVKTKMNIATDRRATGRAKKATPMTSAALWVDAIKNARALIDATGSVANATALLKALGDWSLADLGHRNSSRVRRRKSAFCRVEDIATEEHEVPIWVDADACPAAVKELLFRAADRTQTRTVLVSNQIIRTPSSSGIESVLVPGGMNVADRRIVEMLSAGDLVITADIPLAADAVARGATVIDPRGTLYDQANIGERLAMRNLMDELRGAGQIVRGPSNFTSQDRQAFANQLDRWLAASRKNRCL